LETLSASISPMNQPRERIKDASTKPRRYPREQAPIVNGTMSIQ
jgi:hypothetical protein